MDLRFAICEFAISDLRIWMSEDLFGDRPSDTTMTKMPYPGGYGIYAYVAGISEWQVIHLRTGGGGVLEPGAYK